MRYVAIHVACLIFVFFTGRLAMPRTRHGLTGTPRSLFRADATSLVWLGAEGRRAVIEAEDRGRQVKSRERVRNHGEVFTAEREVKAMCDLVKDETERIDSRFLEPACGDGNFLAEILNRKLAVCDKRYGKSPADWEKFSFLAMASIYGIDILADNVEACQARLFGMWDERFFAAKNAENTKDEDSENIRRVIRFVLEKNILCGNALSMKKVNEKGEDLDEPIVFTEWSFVTGDLVKRREFRFDQLQRREEDLLFAWAEQNQAFVPTPIKDWPPVDFREVANG